jgi:hypothetical protein
MVAHVTCIRARWRREHTKSHAVMPRCMALTPDLSSCRETYNILIQRTLGLNFMPFGQEPPFGRWAFWVASPKAFEPANEEWR